MNLLLERHRRLQQQLQTALPTVNTRDQDGAIRVASWLHHPPEESSVQIGVFHFRCNEPALTPLRPADDINCWGAKLKHSLSQHVAMTTTVATAWSEDSQLNS